MATLLRKTKALLDQCNTDVTDVRSLDGDGRYGGKASAEIRSMQDFHMPRLTLATPSSRPRDRGDSRAKCQPRSSSAAQDEPALLTRQTTTTTPEKFAPVVRKRLTILAPSKTATKLSSMGHSVPSALSVPNAAAQREIVASVARVSGLSRTDKSFASLLRLVAGGPP